jgi:hypothetical protein
VQGFAPTLALDSGKVDILRFTTISTVNPLRPLPPLAWRWAIVMNPKKAAPHD